MTKTTKKNLKQKAYHSAGSGGTVRRGRSRFESEIKLAALSPQSQNQGSLVPSGGDGMTLSSNGGQEGSSAEASTRQKTALMLCGLIMEAQKLGLVRLYRATTKQGNPCVKVTLELSPNGEWSLNGNTISYFGS